MKLSSHYSTTAKVVDNTVPGLYRSKSTGMIALMYDYRAGTFSGIILEVGTHSKEKIGTVSDDWISSMFEPYYGSVTLVQDR